MTKENVKTTVNEKILMYGTLIFAFLLIIKFREPLYDLMWTDKYFLRPAIEKSVENTYNNLDKVFLPIGRMFANGLMKLGEFLDKIPPRF